MKLTRLCIVVCASVVLCQGRHDDKDNSSKSEEEIQVLDSTAAEVYHNGVTSYQITVHALLPNEDGEDVSLTLTCWRHGLITRATCATLTPGKYHLNREKGNNVTVLAHAFDRSERKLTFKVAAYGTSQ
jgi:hypothetical protein